MSNVLASPTATASADSDLEQRVRSFLQAKHVPGLRNLEIKADSGVVTLKGRVQTFYEKQLCNQCCRRVAGVRELVNAVHVIGDQPGAAVVA
jgi:osmotically-inducible protein OsmY